MNGDFDFSDTASYNFLRLQGAQQFKHMLEYSYVGLRQYLDYAGDKAGYDAATKFFDSFSDVATPERIEQAKVAAAKAAAKYK